MNILLTGATGFVGRFLEPYLAQAGHQLTAVVRPNRHCQLSTTQIIEINDLSQCDFLSLIHI